MQSSASIPAVSLSQFINSFPAVGFSGSRRAGSQAVISASRFLHKVWRYSGHTGVGCAKGVDSVFRSAFPASQVFHVQPPITRMAFAVRSTKLVYWVTINRGLLIAFPAGVAPSALQPGRNFAGHGSGTWGSVALALGLSVPVMLVLPASFGFSVPAPVSVASLFSYHSAAPCGGSVFIGFNPMV